MMLGELLEAATSRCSGIYRNKDEARHLSFVLRLITPNSPDDGHWSP
jgi:hypothetical protein